MALAPPEHALAVVDQDDADQEFDLDIRSGIRELTEYLVLQANLTACDVDVRPFDRAGYVLRPRGGGDSTWSTLGCQLPGVELRQGGLLKHQSRCIGIE